MIGRVLLFIPAFLFVASLQGCATYSMGYTPKVEKNKSYELSDYPNVTYSLSFSQHIGNAGPVTQERIVKKITKILGASGLYSSVRYVSLDEASSNHLHFQVHLSGTGYEESQMVGMASGYLLMTIPMNVDYYFDMSVFHIQEGREVFSLAAAEKINQTLWLPLIIVSPFLNNYTTLDSVLSRQVNYLLAGLASGDVPHMN